MQNLITISTRYFIPRFSCVSINILLFLFTLHAQLVPYHNYDSFLKNNTSGRACAFTGDVLLRAALVHTVDTKSCTLEEGQKGWGRVNKEKMDTFISVNRNKNNGKIIEHRLGEYQTHFYFYQADNTGKISTTLAWEKPVEVDLDLRIIYNGTVYFPLSLNKDGSTVRLKDNSSMPIEKVEIPYICPYEFTIQVSGKKSSLSSISYCLCVSGASFSKRQTGKTQLTQKIQRESIGRNTRVQGYLHEKNVSRRQVSPDGRVRGIFDVINGEPVYVEAYNKESAITVSTDKVLPGGSSGLDLTGTDLPGPMGIWDVDVVYKQHKEFGNRLIEGESGELSEHADHVAGTMIASGVNPQAKGMAPAAQLKSFGWDDDDLEMNTEASNGMIISNHSYGLNPHEYTARWDAIVCSNPYFCIVNAIGNAMMAPFHSIATYANSKNLVAVGAVDEMPNGWQGPDVPIYILSNKGPAPDGRIKPDIMACGHKVISTTHKSEEYKENGGTSMASPNVAGSIGLLQEHYYMTHGQTYMEAATVRGLVLHTANEIDEPGPDYISGWGLLCTERAAKMITENNGGKNKVIQELTLTNGGTVSVKGTATGTKVTVTICWTDPTPQDTTGIALVNDLDLRVTAGGTTYKPWILDPQDPEKKAVTGDNNLDNVEKVETGSAQTSDVVITISHKGTLASSQKFSLFCSGISIDNANFISLTAPDGGEEWDRGKEYQITWSDNITHKVHIDLLKENAVVLSIAKDLENSGSYAWTIPPTVDPGDKYKVRITSAENNTLSDESSGYFTIKEGIVAITVNDPEPQNAILFYAVPNPALKHENRIDFFLSIRPDTDTEIHIFDPLGNKVKSFYTMVAQKSTGTKHYTIARWNIPGSLSNGAYRAVLELKKNHKLYQFCIPVGIQK